MKLYYYQNPEYPNVGDDLNQWMWDELLPGAFDGEGDTQFVGIGTLLNNQLPPASKRLVFSTGVGYGTALPQIGPSWRFYCVRGPLSAQALGLPAQAAVTDGAALLRRLRCLPDNPQQYRFSYMPHALFSQRAGASWEKVCAEIGFGYIDARWPFDRVVDVLSRTEVLITEAMHGAIIADTLRVPWVPVQSHGVILPFKWLDWTESVGLAYHPYTLTGLWEHQGLTLRRIKYWLKGGTHDYRMRRAVKALVQIAKNAKPLLSDDVLLESRVVQLEDRLEQFRCDYPEVVQKQMPDSASLNVPV